MTRKYEASCESGANRQLSLRRCSQIAYRTINGKGSRFIYQALLPMVTFKWQIKKSILIVEF